MEQQNQKFKVYRTKEGTIFEIAFAIMTIVVWALIITFLNKAPDIIPTHFDLKGQPNDWGSKYGIMVICIIMSLVGVGLMIGAYFPHKNISLKPRPKTIRQLSMEVRMMRVLGLIMPLLTLAIAWTSLVAYGHGGPNMLPILSVVVLMIVISVIFTVLTYIKK